MTQRPQSAEWTSAPQDQPDYGLAWLYREPKARWERRFAVVLGVLLAVILLPLLGRVPRAFVDDSWSAPMTAYTLAFEGSPRNPIQVGRGGVATFLVEPRICASLFGAMVYRIAGFGLTQGRVAAVVFAAVLVFSTYGTMRRLFGPATAAAVSLMTAVDPWVFLCGRTFREEIFLAGWLWLSWWFLLGAIDRQSAARALAGGFCIGLAFWTHPNALVFTGAALVALIVTSDLRTLKGKWLLWALGGFSAGLAPYVAYVCYVQAISDVSWIEQVGRRGAAFTRPLAEILAVEKSRWMGFLRLPERTPLLLLYLWAVGWAALRGRHNDRLLLMFILLASLLMPLLQPVETSRYYVVLVPGLAALVWRSLPTVGAAATAAKDRNGPVVARTGLRRGMLIGTLVVFGLMSLMPTFAVLYAHRHADYDRWVTRVGEHIPKDATVMAHTMFWTGLHDRHFVSSIPPSFSEWQSVAEAVAFIRDHQPEYLVQASSLYGGVGGLLARPGDLRATVFGQACEEVAGTVPSRILAEFYERDFGAVRVWKLDWSDQNQS